MPLRCLIVDDNHAFLEAAQLLLEREGLNVVGVAATGNEAVRKAEQLRPDVILVDVSLGEESGFDVARLLVDGDPGNQTAVILISTRAEADIAELIAESPAAGFVPKVALSASAIRRLVDGRIP
jgi:two-component system, NarL family, nitrate/nitrite response regulator NarL